jgi:ribosomal protein L19E
MQKAPHHVNLTKDSSIAHDVSAKFNASRVSLIPASGRGLVAGSSARLVLELAGITNMIAKMHSGSKNGLNNARATIEALKALKRNQIKNICNSTNSNENSKQKGKRVGRGGGRGKTSGRGTKGQKARAGHRIMPAIREQLKKLPKMRGRGVGGLRSIQDKPRRLINVSHAREVLLSRATRSTQRSSLSAAQYAQRQR